MLSSQVTCIVLSLKKIMISVFVVKQTIAKWCEEKSPLTGWPSQKKKNALAIADNGNKCI